MGESKCIGKCEVHTFTELNDLIFKGPGATGIHLQWDFWKLEWAHLAGRRLQSKVAMDVKMWNGAWYVVLIPVHCIKTCRGMGCGWRLNLWDLNALAKRKCALSGLKIHQGLNLEGEKGSKESEGEVKIGIVDIKSC